MGVLRENFMAIDFLFTIALRHHHHIPCFVNISPVISSIRD